MADHPIRLVCFDLGGVLVQIAHTWEEAAALAGYRLSSAPRSLISLPEMDPYQAGTISADDYLTGVQRYLQLSSIDAALSVHDFILKAPYPGTLELIEGLHQYGIATACLSNTNALHWKEMVEGDRFPNVNALQFRIASHELGLNKPDPAFYAAVERVTGVAGHQIAYFDDTAGHVEGAKACGWNAFLIDPTGDTSAQMRSRLADFELP